MACTTRKAVWTPAAKKHFIHRLYLPANAFFAISFLLNRSYYWGVKAASSSSAYAFHFLLELSTSST